MTQAYIYCFIREDISPEQKIVQTSHVCYEAGQLTDKNIKPSLILLSARDEDDLLFISYKLECADIESSIFYEPDINSVDGYKMGYSAICTRPIISAHDREFFKQWNLFKHTD